MTATSFAEDAKSWLLKSDRARGGINDGVEWEVLINNVQNGQTSQSTFQVKVKQTNILATCLAPARQKGETYLFNDRNLWVFRTNLRKPISVSPRQRLTGQTANGDIAATNYAKDYEATFLANEIITGEKSKKLLLKAKGTDLTYDQIHYWVSEKNGLALQADFLTLEGKPIKRATYKYDNKIMMDGKSEPFISEMIITESNFPENKSVLTYQNLKSTKLSDSLFNVNNLAR